LFTRPEPVERQRGLVWGTLANALAAFKGSPGREGDGRRAHALPLRGAGPVERLGRGELPAVRLSPAAAAALAAAPGDLVYVCDRRGWLGGLRSAHAVVGAAPAADAADGGAAVELDPETFDAVVTPKRRGRPLVVERLY
jgi:hypothetical protein